MWDYNKLFAEGNVIGVKNIAKGTLFPMVVEKNNTKTLNLYKNDKLTFHAHRVVDVSHLYSTDFEIQYIIRLDEHGNVIELLFDRKKNMPKPMPELETGMFVLIFNYNHTETRLGYINAERNTIIYQSGGWDYVDDNKDKILKIYSIDCNCFDGCSEHRVIWCNPEYQSYLDSKSN